MAQKISLVCITIAVLVANSQLAVEIKASRIIDFFHSLANTTFGIIHEGVNIFEKAVYGVINKFGRIEDRLRALLELFKKQLVNGIPKLPISDPLHFDKTEFDVNHDAARLIGNAEDITIKRILKFNVDIGKFANLGNFRFKFDLNLTFPYIMINGIYKVDGSFGQIFMIHGNGLFWAHLINLKIGLSPILKFNLPAQLRIEKINIDVKLQKLENNFENFTNDKEIGDLYNKAMSELAPEALDILWSEFKSSVEAQVLKYINSLLENASVVNLAKKLFNII